MYWIWLVHWCWCYISVLVYELESCDLKNWVQKSWDSLRASVCQIFSFFLNSSGLVHPILVYHNFRGKSNFGRSGMFYRTLILTGKIWQGVLAQNLPISLFWICLLETGGSLVPNQSPLQTESQSKTRTPSLWFSRGDLDFLFEEKFIYNFQNLTPPKFDSAAVSSSRHRARRRDSIGKQIWKARNTKPIISL